MSTVVRSDSPQRPASLVSSEKKAVDVVTVEAIATEVQLERNFSFLSALGLAFSLLNSWTGESWFTRNSSGSADAAAM